MNGVSPLLARAALWRWTARGLWYPDTAFRHSLEDPHLWGALQRASTDGAGGGVVADALRSLRHAAQLLQASPRGEGPDPASARAPSLEEEYTHLFERQVLVSPHEGRYSRMGPPGPSSATMEVSAFYAAFGFQVGADRAELPDHISMECEFVAVLLAKEALAEADRRGDRVAVIRAARAKFLGEHLAVWLPSFAMRLEEHRRLAFYPAAARLALGLLAAEEGDRSATRRGVVRQGG